MLPQRILPFRPGMRLAPSLSWERLIGDTLRAAGKVARGETVGEAVDWLVADYLERPSELPRIDFGRSGGAVN